MIDLWLKSKAVPRQNSSIEVVERRSCQLNKTSAVATAGGRRRPIVDRIRGQDAFAMP
jgi:hypothetical protein